ncbi:hypothetical protein NDU88_000920 [Pleurodeles waltl]|uniref:Uncharacterized protein n=1 Tax=Pleurodeles waltl TaxID=8319 RepID=A0AAV7SYD2_PLEWA|nr:hypothetical protein NDU88_000920 [Pleurodeles waltl]
MITAAARFSNHHNAVHVCKGRPPSRPPPAPATVLCLRLLLFLRLECYSLNSSVLFPWQPPYPLESCVSALTCFCHHKCLVPVVSACFQATTRVYPKLVRLCSGMSNQCSRVIIA